MSDEKKTDLPLADYDHLTLGELAAALHSLDEPGVEAILAFEREHAGRLPVITLLEHRLDGLKNGAPVSGTPDDRPVTSASAAAGTSPAQVTPATSGPPMNPPSHGTPTNPAQPR